MTFFLALKCTKTVLTVFGPRWGSIRRYPDPLIWCGGDSLFPYPSLLNVFGVSISGPSMPRTPMGELTMLPRPPNLMKKETAPSHTFLSSTPLVFRSRGLQHLGASADMMIWVFVFTPYQVVTDGQTDEQKVPSVAKSCANIAEWDNKTKVEVTNLPNSEEKSVVCRIQRKHFVAGHRMWRGETFRQRKLHIYQ